MGSCLSTGSTKEARDPWLDETTKLGPGESLQEDYKVRSEVLGYGRVANVRVAYDRRSGKKVAVKACSKKVLETRPARISKVSEIYALQKVWEGPPVSDKVVELYGTYEDNNYFYLVMELCSGGDLFQNLAHRDVFLEQDAATVGRQLLEAVCHCHAHGVIHRDFKPENILFVNDHSFDIKVVDFGSAVIASNSEVLRDFMGTPFYAAPEVWTRGYNKECDVWSIGAILYVLVGGLPPALTRKSAPSNRTWCDLQAGKITGLPDHVSGALIDLLTKLMEPEPLKRITASQALKHPWITGQTAFSMQVLEGSIRNIRAYAHADKFQKAAVVLLAVLLDPEETSTLGAKIREVKGRTGDLTEFELERLLREVGLEKQANRLASLRDDMLGFSTGPMLNISAAEFLDLLECRQLALQHLDGRKQRMEGGLGSSSMRTFLEQSNALKKATALELGGSMRLAPANEKGMGTRAASWHNLAGLGYSLEKLESLAGSQDATQQPGRRSESNRRGSGALTTVHGDKLYETLMQQKE